MAIPSGYSLLGRIGYNDRGVYSENNEYVRGDVVYHEGSSYVALATVTGVTPADDNTNWKYLARGFGTTELSEIDATDTSGFAGVVGKKVKGQTLIDKIAEYVMSKVVATDAFQTYLQKFLVDNCVTERSDLSLSAAQGKALQDALTVHNNELKETSSNLAIVSSCISNVYIKKIANEGEYTQVFATSIIDSSHFCGLVIADGGLYSFHNIGNVTALVNRSTYKVACNSVGKVARLSITGMGTWDECVIISNRDFTLTHK